VSPVFDDNPPTYEGLWAEATKAPDCSPKEYPDLTLVTCQGGLTLWYFTKPNHPAHPGVIKRFVTEKNGTFYVTEEGHSFASDAAQPAFKAWLAQIKDLDRKVKEYLQQRLAKPPQNSN